MTSSVRRATHKSAPQGRHQREGTATRNDEKSKCNPVQRERCGPMEIPFQLHAWPCIPALTTLPRMDPCQGNAEVDGCHQGNEATRCTRRPRRERCMPYLSAAPPIDVNPMDDAR